MVKAPLFRPDPAKERVHSSKHRVWVFYVEGQPTVDIENLSLTNGVGISIERYDHKMWELVRSLART